MAEERDNRFPSLTEADISLLIEGKDAKKTKQVVKMAVAIFEKYCQQKNINITEDTTIHVPNSLNQTLRQFYAEVRQVNKLILLYEK